jgi:ribosomal protein L11 methyltransferase
MSEPPGGGDLEAPVVSVAHVAYDYVSIDVAEDDVDDAAAELFDLGASGVEQRDATTLARGVPGKVTLIGSFADENEARAAAAALSPDWSPRVERVVGDAWRDAWKKYFEPFCIAGDIVVSPPWTPYAPKDGERVVVLEPGRAFGTGLHETTRLVARALVERVERVERFEGRSVLDVGCGSGILSLVALALGAARAHAIDTDPEAVDVTRENAARNGFASPLIAEQTTADAVTGQFAIVLANIEALTLVELAPALIARLAPAGLLILSGILAPDVAPTQLVDIRKAYAALKEVDLLRQGEWVAVVCRA